MINRDKIKFYLILKNLLHRLSVFFCIVLLSLHSIVNAQNSCPIINQTFQSGENLWFKVYYNWGLIWVTAGEASFSVALEEFNSNKVYHFLGLGSTYPKYDWFYKVRDRYESYADTLTLKPLRFIREAREGKTYTKDDYNFNQQKNKVYSFEQRNKNPPKLDSITVNSCTNDVVTAIFYARCVDYSLHRPNDTVPITFVLDGKLYYYHITYLGKEIISNELLGKVRCIKFSTKLIEGTIFKEGEEMTVWVTDDNNKIPVYVETPIIVGNIKVKIIGYSGLRNKIDCVILENLNKK